MGCGWSLQTVGGAPPRGLVEHACVCVVCSVSALSASQLWLCRPALCRGFSLPVDVCAAELHLFRRSMHLGFVEVLQKQLSLSKGYSNPRLIVDCVMLMVSMLFECDSTRTAVCCELSLGDLGRGHMSPGEGQLWPLSKYSLAPTINWRIRITRNKDLKATISNINNKIAWLFCIPGGWR